MDRSFSPINTVEEAVHEAQLWAGEFEADIRKAAAFAHEWFEVTEQSHRTQFHLRWMLKAFGRYCQQQEAAWFHHRGLVWQEATQWNIEIAKHLAALNGAGVAGSAALLASRFADSLTVRISLPLFAVGLILAVFHLWLNTQALVKRLKASQASMQKFADAATWADLKLPEETPKGELTPEDWSACAVRVGWLSAVTAIAGAISIGVALF